MIIPNEDYAQVNVRYEGADLPFGAEWTLGFSINSFAGDPEDLGALMVDALQTNDIQAFTATGNTISSVLVKYGPNETGPMAEVVAGITCNGGTGGESPAACALVKKNTAHGGRRGRGRFYIPGVPQSAFGIGGLTGPTYQAAANASLQDFLDQLTAAGAGPVLLHGPDHPTESPYLITSFFFDSRIATQRRRNRP